MAFGESASLPCEVYLNRSQLESEACTWTVRRRRIVVHRVQLWDCSALDGVMQVPPYIKLSNVTHVGVFGNADPLAIWEVRSCFPNDSVS